MEGIYVMQERERLEAELTEARRELEEAKASFEEVQKNAQKSIWGLVEERGTALARAERAEAERDEADRKAKWFEVEGTRLLAEIEGLKSATHLAGLRADARAKERDEALALADARRRALEEIGYLTVDHRGDNTGTLMLALETAIDALSLPAPEALRQQQEREAEMVAMIETLRGALDNLLDHHFDGSSVKHDVYVAAAVKALSLTPKKDGGK